MNPIIIVALFFLFVLWIIWPKNPRKVAIERCSEIFHQLKKTADLQNAGRRSAIDEFHELNQLLRDFSLSNEEVGLPNTQVIAYLAFQSFTNYKFCNIEGGEKMQSLIAGEFYRVYIEGKPTRLNGPVNLTAIPTS